MFMYIYKLLLFLLLLLFLTNCYLLDQLRIRKIKVFILSSLILSLMLFFYLCRPEFMTYFSSLGRTSFNLNMLCLGIVLCVFPWHLSSLVFFMLPGSVVWCLTLIWGNFPVLLLQIFLLLLSLFILFLVFPLHIGYTFCSCPTVPGYSVLFFLFCFQYFFLFVFQF